MFNKYFNADNYLINIASWKNSNSIYMFIAAAK